jgi:hypothetical protein
VEVEAGHPIDPNQPAAQKGKATLRYRSGAGEEWEVHEHEQLRKSQDFETPKLFAKAA